LNWRSRARDEIETIGVCAMKNFRLLKRTQQATEYSCGASALQSVLSYWGRDVDEHELMQLMGTTQEEGTYPEKIVHAARVLGFQAEARQNLSLDEVREFTAAGHPMIALAQVWRSQNQAAVKRVHEEWDAGHYIVVLGVDEQYVYFQDPYVRMCKAFASRRMFEAHWHQVMGGDIKRNPKLDHLGIFVRGAKPAQSSLAQEVEKATLDFAKLGSLNLIAMLFPKRIFPVDLLERMNGVLDPQDVRPNAFIFLSKEKNGQLFGMEGSGLQEGADAVEINAVVTALTSRMVEQHDPATTVANVEAAVKAAAQGDFGLSADALKSLGSRLEPGHSALVVLFENLWERRFREIGNGMGGRVIRQTLITAEDLDQAAKELT
jgi:predicted double-glycine peptidase